MAINSINTNSSVFTSLRTINSQNSSQADTQNRVSTGLKIASALADASNFSIAQGLRGELRASSAVNQGLNNTAGATSVALAGTTALSDLAGDIQTRLVELSNPANTVQQNELIQQDLNRLLEQAGQFVQDSSFNGTNLLESGAEDVETPANADGGTLIVSGQGGVGDAVAALQGALGGDPATILANEFTNFEAAVNGALGSLGADQRAIQQQTQQNQDIADATEEGLGNIVDAELGRESARLAAQDVQSQLSVQTLGIANQSTQSILGLFR